MSRPMAEQPVMVTRPDSNPHTSWLNIGSARIQGSLYVLYVSSM